MTSAKGKYFLDKSIKAEVTKSNTFEHIKTYIFYVTKNIIKTTKKQEEISNWKKEKYSRYK